MLRCGKCGRTTLIADEVDGESVCGYCLGGEGKRYMIGDIVGYSFLAVVLFGIAYAVATNTPPLP